MALLDELVEKIDERDNTYYDLDKNWTDILNLIKDVAFQAKVEGDMVYMQMLCQVKRCDSVLANGYIDDVKELYTLTSDDARQFYITKTMNAVKEFLTDTSVHIALNMSTGVGTAYIGRNMDFEKDPKTNFGILYTACSPKFYDKTPPAGAMRTINLKAEDDDTKEVLSNLIKILDYGKRNHIKDLEKLVDYPHQMYWGVDGKEVNPLIDEEDLETERPIKITLPVDHKTTSKLEYNDELNKVLKGKSYSTLNFEQNGYIQTFDSERKAKDFFYSVIDYVNDKYSAGIESVEQHWWSNLWPTAESEEMADAATKVLTFKAVKVAYVQSQIVVRLEIWQKGQVYIITNKDIAEQNGRPSAAEVLAKIEAAMSTDN